MGLFKKALSLVCIGLFLINCSCIVVNTPPIAYNPVNSYDSVVKIAMAVKTPEGIGMASGSAWAIDFDHVVTAAHVCMTFIQVQALGMDGGFFVERIVNGKRVTDVAELEIVNADLLNDICVIKLPFHGLTPLKLAKSVSFGERVFIIGAPRGFLGFIFEGRVANTKIHLSEDMLNKILVSAASTGGNSGGPVLNERGEVIGMLIAGVGDFDHLSICTGFEEIKSFLKDLKIAVE